MYKIIILALGCCLFHLIAAAYHIIGGEIYYEYVGYDALTGKHRYLITLKLYRDADFSCGNRQGCLDHFENPVPVNIYTAGGAHAVPTMQLYITDTRSLRDTLKNPCLAPRIQNLEVAFYQDTVDLPAISGGYYVAYQRCCRGENLANIYDSEHEGSTFYTVIPGIERRPVNSSAYFNKDAAIVICAGLPFRYDYAAFDADGDSLTYTLCNALTGGTARNEANATNPPPYDDLVNYRPPYSGSNPMGGAPQIAIDQNGVLTGTPDREGQFVVSVCVNEYDRSTKAWIGIHHKDIRLTVFDCSTQIRAVFPSVLNNCTEEPDLGVIIPNTSTAGYTSSYYWSFGDGTDTITYDQAVFRHNFPDTGRYLVKLVVNPGLSCTDSTTGFVNNYPGLRASFTSTGVCKGSPVQFTDNSSYLYGNIVTRRWDLGVPDDSISDRALGGQVTYTYPRGGDFTVTLTLGTDRQCSAVATRTITVYEVTPFAGNDTILARGQLLQLQASGGEFYAWSPATGLSNSNIANPMLDYNQDIKFLLRVSNSQGCVGYDSISVKYYTGPEIYIPNAFSPNGDGRNDRFRFIPVGIVDYRFFRIFNRWGEEIYSSTDFRNGWDGTIKGVPAPVDTYLWILEGKDFTGKVILKKGTVTLVR